MGQATLRATVAGSLRARLMSLSAPQEVGARSGSTTLGTLSGAFLRCERGPLTQGCGQVCTSECCASKPITLQSAQTEKAFLDGWSGQLNDLVHLPLQVHQGFQPISSFDIVHRYHFGI